MSALERDRIDPLAFARVERNVNGWWDEKGDWHDGVTQNAQRARVRGESNGKLLIAVFLAAFGACVGGLASWQAAVQAAQTLAKAHGGH